MAKVLDKATLGGGKRAATGEILGLIDMVAARAAHTHSGVDKIATVSIDRLDLSVPVVVGEVLHMEARVLKTGTATMLVEVIGKKKGLNRDWRDTSRTLITFVALNDRMRPIRIPQVYLEDTEEERQLHEVQREQRRVLAAWQEEKAQVWEEIEAGSLVPEPSQTGGERVHIRDTVIQLRDNFLPGAVNHVGSIFGGEILTWMERAAKTCATHFTRNANMVTIGLDRLAFKEAIFPTDLLELEGQVTYHTNHEVMVDIFVKLIRDQESIFSHTGHFTVLNLDEVGLKSKLTSSLSLEGATKEELFLYERSMRRHAMWKRKDALWRAGESPTPRPRFATTQSDGASYHR